MTHKYRNDIEPADHLSPITVSAVYDTYWHFAAKRQDIFSRRLNRTPGPWTKDPILLAHKFTNAYRASDRVSQYLIRNVIYRSDLSSAPAELLFRILLFKLFNKIETWELLQSAFGQITYSDYSFERYDSVLTNARAEGRRIYSGAYIMPPAALGNYPAKHQTHLRLLELMMADGLANRLGKAKRMQQGFEILRSYPSIGDFLAYQFITDINYSELTDYSEMDFVVPGPGAKDGLRKCFVDRATLNDAELIRLVSDLQEREFDRLGLAFSPLGGRRLQLIDCQNLFCEVDKYARVAHPEISGITGRVRIKQRFTTKGPLPPPWYPPKWGINEKLKTDFPVGYLDSETASSEQFSLNLEA